MPPLSVRRRFLFSVAANLARAVISLLAGLLVARGLGPIDYGNLAYLLGSFWALRALLDFGSSSAFYTFIAQRHRGRSYYIVYFAWLAFQFVVSAALVVVLIPDWLVDGFWLGQSREMIILALLATFLQNQVWQTVVQAHEAVRKTIRIQSGSLAVIAAHLVIVSLMMLEGWLTVRVVLWAIIVEYLFATVWLSATLRQAHCNLVSDGESCSLRKAFLDYLTYCRPMIVMAVFSFCYEMLDRWLLQRFGGASQQGFYQIASQLSTISLLATTSIMNILWKEIAEANAQGKTERVIELHRKATRLLISLSAFVSCFLGPWAEELVHMLLGSAYQSAWMALLVMLFYPIHQAMGQINATLFMATRQTGIYMRLGVVGLLVGMPISYILVAPMYGSVVPGVELGALGLALKTVGLNVLFTNVQSWFIARHYGVAFQWRYQVAIIMLLGGLGCVAHWLVRWGGGELTNISLLVSLVFAGCVYTLTCLLVLIKWPGFFGMNQAQISVFIAKILGLFNRNKTPGNE